LLPCSSTTVAHKWRRPGTRRRWRCRLFYYGDALRAAFVSPGRVDSLLGIERWRIKRGTTRGPSLLVSHECSVESRLVC
jgi:hypothetical protein